jgi:hypothetical protein
MNDASAAAPAVWVLASATIRQRLAHQLTRALGSVQVAHGELDDHQRLPVGAIVVTTSRDCSPDTCAAMSARGLHVIILAVQRLGHAVKTFTGAGARAVLLMNIDPRDLVAAISQARGEVGGPEVA